MFGNYSKFFGSIVGALAGVAVSKLGLPADLATPEIQAATTVILTGIVTFLFPANQPK